MKFSGKVTSGIGIGARYISAIASSLEKEYGFRPYPGTLNVDVEAIPDLSLKDKVVILLGKGVMAFDCYKAKLSSQYPCVLLIPRKRESADSVVEIAASFNIREKLRLKDGDLVTCEI